MGLFKGLSDIWHKSKAAAVLEALLAEQRSLGLYNMDPHQSANEMVEAAWRIKPELFDGSRNRRAHKMSLAGVALANGMSSIPVGDPHHLSLFTALGKFIYEINRYSGRYRYSALDDDIMMSIMEKYMKTEKELDAAEHLNNMDHLPQADTLMDATDYDFYPAGAIFADEQPSVCQECGSKKIAEIIYGFPNDEDFEDEAAGRVILGGCVATGSDPNWQCLDCGQAIYRR